MHATSISNLVRSCTEIVERLQLADSNDPKIDILRLLQRWLDEQRNGNWLLVVDNIDDLSILEEKLPSQSGPKTMLQLLTYRAHGSILLTTRDRRVGERLGIRGRTIAVTFMSLTEGRELLNSRLPATVEGGIEATDRLVEELGGLPLAIAQAAAYMMENYMTVEDYLDILYEGGEEMQALLDESLSDDRRVDHDSNAVIRTWKLSFDQITREEIKAANMLSLMAMFDRQEVPEELLRGEDSRHGFINTIAVLQNFSLIVQSPERNTWSMHRLVQVCAQVWVQMRDRLGDWQEEALSRLSLYSLLLNTRIGLGAKLSCHMCGKFYQISLRRKSANWIELCSRRRLPNIMFSASSLSLLCHTPKRPLVSS